MSVSFYRDFASMPRFPHTSNDPQAFARWFERFAAAQARAERRGDYWQEAWGGWARVYDLARLHGWRPEGTSHQDPDWSGTYFSNDGARVLKADAAAMAEALDRALKLTIAIARARHGELLPPGRGVVGDAESDADVLDAADAFRTLVDPTLRDRLVGFVRFLRGGAFTIE